jgi:hypothetical protein
LLEVVEAVDAPIRGLAPLSEDSKDALDRRLQAICDQLADQQRRHLGKVRLSDLAGG